MAKEYKSRFASKKRRADQASSFHRNDYCFNNLDRPVLSLRPEFNAKAAGSVACMVFRPWPYVDPDDHDFYPFRVGDGVNDITDFMAPAMHVFCNPPNGEPVSFHTSLCEDESMTDDPDPYTLLRTRLYQWKKTGQGPDYLSVLLPPKPAEGEGYEPRPLPKPSQVLYVQGAVVMTGQKGELYDGPPRRIPMGYLDDDPTPVIRLSGDTANSLLKLFAEKNPVGRLPPGTAEDDYETRMVFGDPVHPDHGRFIYVWNSKKYTVPLSPKLMDNPWIKPLLVDDHKFSRYNVLSLKSAYLPGRHGKADLSPAMTAEQRTIVRKKFVQWSDLLRVPEREELCELLARGFHAFGRIFEYAWADQRDYYNAARAYLVNRVGAVVDGGAAGAPGDDEAPGLEAEKQEWVSGALQPVGSGAGSGLSADGGDEEAGWSDDDGDGDISTPTGEAFGDDETGDADSEDAGPEAVGLEDAGPEDSGDGDAPFTGDDSEGDAEFADAVGSGDHAIENPPTERPSAQVGRAVSATGGPPQGVARPQPQAVSRPAQAKSGGVAQEMSEMAKKSAAAPGKGKPAPKSTKPAGTKKGGK